MTTASDAASTIRASQRPDVPLARLTVFSLLVAVAMLPVGLVLAALGIFVLKVSGGAAHDTSVVVAVAAVAITDFWAGGIVSRLTRSTIRDTAIAWGIARAVVLLAIVVLVAPGTALVAPAQLLLAIGAAPLGARVAAAQARMREASDRDQARRRRP